MYKYLTGRGGEGEARLFSVVSSERTRIHKLKYRKYHLCKKSFFIVRVVKPLPRVASQKGYGVSIPGGIQNPERTEPWAVFFR